VAGIAEDSQKIKALVPAGVAKADFKVLPFRKGGKGQLLSICRGKRDKSARVKPGGNPCQRVSWTRIKKKSRLHNFQMGRKGVRALGEGAGGGVKKNANHCFPPNGKRKRITVSCQQVKKPGTGGKGTDNHCPTLEEYSKLTWLMEYRDVH